MQEMAVDFDDFFPRAWKRVLAFVARRVGPDVAQDVAAEAMLTAWRKWDSRPGADFDVTLYWVLAIARNKVLHEWRSADVQRRLSDGLVLDASTAERDTVSAERVALSGIALVESFNALSPADQDAVLDRPGRRQQGAGTHPRGRQEPRASTAAMRRSRARARLARGLLG